MKEYSVADVLNPLFDLSETVCVTKRFTIKQLSYEFWIHQPIYIVKNMVTNEIYLSSELDYLLKRYNLDRATSSLL